MEAYRILSDLITSPCKLYPYKQLAKYYEDNNMPNEAKAILELIEKKSLKNEKFDDTNSG
jgi:hypothetical protein